MDIWLRAKVPKVGATRTRRFVCSAALQFSGCTAESFTRSIVGFPRQLGCATLRHINRRLRAGKTVQNRRRRATVRREKIPREPLSLMQGAGRPRGAVPPSQETDGVRNRESRKRSRTRDNLCLPREPGEEVFLMRHSVRVLLSLCSTALLIVLSAAPRTIAQTKTAAISGIVTDPQGIGDRGCASQRGNDSSGGAAGESHFRRRWPVQSDASARRIIESGLRMIRSRRPSRKSRSPREKCANCNSASRSSRSPQR